MKETTLAELGLTLQGIEEEIRRVASTGTQNYIEFENGCVVLVSSDELTSGQRAAIASIEKEGNTLTIRLHNGKWVRVTTGEDSEED